MMFGGDGFSRQGEIMKTIIRWLCLSLLGLVTAFDTAATNPTERRYMRRIPRDIGVPVTSDAQSSRQSVFVFAVKQVESYSAVVLPMSGSYSQHGEAIGRIAASLGAPPSGPPFGRYYNSPEYVAEAELKWEVGFPVPSNTAARAPFEPREFPAETVVYAVIEGSHEASRPWRDLVEWAFRHGYEITGPAMEIWMNGPKTEMRLPVRKPE
jgi:AraC family transcriptional regulator